jgi:hypothetical protein
VRKLASLPTRYTLKPLFGLWHLAPQYLKCRYAKQFCPIKNISIAPVYIEFRTSIVAGGFWLGLQPEFFLGNRSGNNKLSDNFLISIRRAVVQQT